MASFWKPEACGQTVLPDRSILIGQKIGGKCQNWKIQMRYFEWFLNTVKMWKPCGKLKKYKKKKVFSAFSAQQTNNRFCFSIFWPILDVVILDSRNLLSLLSSYTYLAKIVTFTSRKKRAEKSRITFKKKEITFLAKKMCFWEKYFFRSYGK